MKYVIVKKIEDLKQLLMNDYGFPMVFRSKTDAELARIEAQMDNDEPILIHETMIGENK